MENVAYPRLNKFEMKIEDLKNREKQNVLELKNPIHFMSFVMFFII